MAILFLHWDFNEALTCCSASQFVCWSFLQRIDFLCFVPVQLILLVVGACTSIFTAIVVLKSLQFLVKALTSDAMHASAKSEIVQDSLERVSYSPF